MNEDQKQPTILVGLTHGQRKRNALAPTTGKLSLNDLLAGEIKPSEAAELANIAGKMIGSAKVQVEYYVLRKESPRINFLEASPCPDRLGSAE